MNNRRNQRMRETWKIIRNPNARRLRETDNYTYVRCDLLNINIRNDSTAYDDLLINRLGKL